MKKKLNFGNITFNFFNYAVFIAFTLICVFPFYYIFIHSISSNDLVAKGQIMLYPRGIHFENYLNIFAIRGLSQAAFISVARTVVGTVSSVLCTGILAFAISRQELWLRKFWYRFFIVTMYIQAGLIPTYLNIRMLGLLNNFLVYVIGVISVFNLILFKTFIESVPASMSESAEIDGAGYWSVFFRIMLPLCKPIIATLAVFVAVGQWNSYLDTLLYITNSRLHTLQFTLNRYLRETQALANLIRDAAAMGYDIDVSTQIKLTTTSVRMTITMVVVLPILFVYPFMQRFFVKGIMIGAIKG